ncbi:MAG: glycine/betaine ABC transporter ATP-binding protein, partial [Actinomycetota bacterium]|nr:glycine/betaine ABC transporter ATP-binding protein [Actinomycetota bacterium]
RQAGLSHILVVDDERRLMGLAEAEEVARLAERDDRGLGAAVDNAAPRVEPRTPLREILPLFIGDGDVPVAVVGERGGLEGVIVRGSLIAGLTMTAESPDGGGENLSGVGARETSEVGPDGGEE